MSGVYDAPLGPARLLKALPRRPSGLRNRRGDNNSRKGALRRAKPDATQTESRPGGLAVYKFVPSHVFYSAGWEDRLKWRI
jgi:hypothetical protein